MTDLENQVTTLASLPGDVRALTDRTGVVESQIVQLRGEMREEFSAIRSDIAEMRSDITGLRNDMAGLRGELGELREGMADNTRELAGQILATQREMRLLHEEVIDRISRIGQRQ